MSPMILTFVFAAFLPSVANADAEVVTHEGGTEVKFPVVKQAKSAMVQIMKQYSCEDKDCPAMEFNDMLLYLEAAIFSLRNTHLYYQSIEFDEEKKEEVDLYLTNYQDLNSTIKIVQFRLKSRKYVPNRSKYLHRLMQIVAKTLKSLKNRMHVEIPVNPSPVSSEQVIPNGSLEDAVFTLDNGVKMPLVGFGTWQLSGEECKKAVLAALEAGYRHIDTAQGYRNEKEIGEAIKESGIPRKEIFLVTKLSRQDHFHDVRAALEAQLKDLGTTYVDLYMIHGPHRNSKKNHVAWKQMEDLLEEGLVRSIGLSNFGIRQMKEITSRGRIKPMYVQNKLSPYNANGQADGENQLEFCAEHNIALMSYSTLNAWPYKLSPLKDIFIGDIAKAHDKSPAQVILRWALQMGAGVIPRSSKPKRIRENIDIFDFSLNANEMMIINSLSKFLYHKGNQLSFPGGTVFDGYISNEDLLELPHDILYHKDEQIETVPHDADPTKMIAHFVNEGNDNLLLYWIDHNGEKHQVAEIGPSQKSEITTYDAHVFESSNGKKMVMKRENGYLQTFVLAKAPTEDEEAKTKIHDDL